MMKKTMIAQLALVLMSGGLSLPVSASADNLLGNTNEDNDFVCAQVVTYGQVPDVQCWVSFASPCDVPDGWVAASSVGEGGKCVSDADVAEGTGYATFTFQQGSLYIPAVSITGSTGERELFEVEMQLVASEDSADSLQFALTSASPIVVKETKEFLKSDSGSSVQLYAGETIRVFLESMATTGYIWIVKGMDPAVLKSTGNYYDDECSESVTIGCQGRDVWTFEAVDTGSTMLEMVYQQPWEGDSSTSQSFILDVMVE